MPAELTRDDEIKNPRNWRPHVVLLGAGASRAALPKGDANEVAVPLMPEIARELDLVDLFPTDLRELAVTNFEAAFSALSDRAAWPELNALEAELHAYFASLELPPEPNLYDLLNLSLRPSDAIFTFNWDPFLMASRGRLVRHVRGERLPRLFFLHGNVLIGWCDRDQASGILGRTCSSCGQLFTPTPLLFPVTQKDYNGHPFIARQWEAVKFYLEECFWFTIFGYSAPATDVEARELLKDAWGTVESRPMEQTEIIDRPDADKETLSENWKPFIHTHHYEIHGSFTDSWMAKHPRRTGEAYRAQFVEASFIDDNPVPDLRDVAGLAELVAWFQPLFDAEDAMEA
jgi:hypothetical protein